mmetsp:Transcript_20929/g.36013  ORF Transcript_20929/g.36013 Transcript_20929/m.36013 type:complete len:101 (-) Transcript_20929:363-665(-)
MTLRIVKVRRHCNYRPSNFFAQITLSIRLQFGQYHARYFFRGVVRVATVAITYDHIRAIVVIIGSSSNFVWHELLILLYGCIAILSSYQTLHVEDGIFRV